MAHPGKLKFESEVDCIKREAEKLKKQNVEIIIALGHSGLDEDIIIAKSVPYLDVIVGGHSHTFLYTGEYLVINIGVVAPSETMSPNCIFNRSDSQM